MTSFAVRLRGFGRDTRGVSILEFAFGFPLLLYLGLSGMELANQALLHLKISQAALTLADNASRVGEDTDLPTLNLRETDINDALTGTRLFGRAFDLTDRGRITLSSLERDAASVQRIHWQRCIGLKRGVGWDSSYGRARPTDGIDDKPENAGPLAPTGMGPVGGRVNAPPNGAVMFVEINYEYEPFVDLKWIGNPQPKFHYVASFMVRDPRNLAQIFNPTPAATRYTCDKYTAI